MGYDLHITRRDEWADPTSGPPIAREDFLAAIAVDPGWVADEHNTDMWLYRPAPGSFPEDERPWLSTDGHDPWLAWQPSGELTTKHPARGSSG